METFVLDILNVIEFEELENVVLVGHSYGARSINGVVDRVPERVKRLIYFDGGLAPSGTSRLDSMPRSERDKRVQSSLDWDGGISVPPPPAETFGIVDHAISSRVNRLMTPQPLNVEQTAVTLNNPIGNGRPATYVRCTDPALPAVQPSAEYAKSRLDWRYLELPAGHDVILTHPEQVAHILLAESAI